MNTYVSRQGGGIRLDAHDARYPKSVAGCIRKPPTLYCRGAIGLLSDERTRLAVVGSRRTTPNTRTALGRILTPQRVIPITIVSGLALGIDTLAHEIALEHGLPTIAVLGSSVEDDEVYPRTNALLARRIRNQGGLLISPFAPGTPTYPYNFPARNQVMAAIADAVLIGSAAAKSGALITARWAADYGRDLFVIPGAITDPLYEGSNRLLADGAGPALTHKDLLAALGIPQSRLPLATPARSSAESEILSKIAAHPYTVDELLQSLSLPPAAAQAVLTQLELRKLITIQPNGMIFLNQ